MDYQRFLRRRGAIWKSFEERLHRSRRYLRTVTHQDVERLAFQYRQVLHDLALARSRFPGTRTVEQLSELALEGARLLQRDYRQRSPGLTGFLTRNFPRAFREQLFHIGLAASIFLLAAVFGLFTATVQPGIGLAVLGPDAVQGLEQGKLWTESLSTILPPAFASSAIATNNMSVAISGWAGGALAGLGGLYILLLNGLLLGAVFGITGHYSLSGQLAEFVAAHGPLEITLILVVTGSGFSLGRALVEAGEVPRSEALLRAARTSLTVLLGCLPWFLLLGLVEGFVSPSPEVPLSSKLLLGVALESLFLVAAWNPFLSEKAP